jgi:murein L,D-transpeptidase YcbB/YkuD
MLAKQRSASARDVAWFDVALSIALSRHVTDIHLGRVNPKNISVGINVDAKRFDRAKVVRWVAEHGHVQDVVRDLEPRFLQYRNLKVSLARYRALASRSDLGPVMATEVVRPGGHFEGAAALRRRLAAVGDLPAAEARLGLGADSTLYDPATAGAVKRFQERHGLDPDSVLGPGTLAVINVPFARRVMQFELAMERIRWLPAFDSGRFVVVNVPSFQLYAFDTLRLCVAAPDLTMNVVVGRIKWAGRPRSERAALRNLLSLLVVSARHPQMRSLPRLRRNRIPEEADMEIYSGSGDVGRRCRRLPPTSARGSWGRRHPRDRGAALGLPGVIFPNDDHVFMHGTPATELFARSRRDFSHGCIRLEDPARLGVWVLRDPAKWPMREVKRAMEGPSPRRVNLTRPLPVVLYYSTAVVTPDGTVMFFDDVYRHDVHLENVLAEGYPYPP